MWIVAVEVPRAAGPVFADAFSESAESFACFERDGGRLWRLEALLETAPDRAALEARLALAAAACGVAVPALAIELLPERDWLAENRRHFPALTIGRFFIHGSFFEGAVPAGRIGIALDAGLAFGSGTHETTRGCLLAIAAAARRRSGAGRRLRRPLDLGCGSGILAIAMAGLLRRPVVAADIDPVAVAVTRANARRNCVGPLIRPALGAARQARALRRGRPYDLIVANILARPLERLAPALARMRARGGVVILSGLLARDAAGVIAAYRRQGLALHRRLALGAWVTLVLGGAGARI